MMSNPKTQKDIVDNFLETVGRKDELVDQIELPGLHQLHQLSADEAIEKLFVVLRIRPIITEFKWELEEAAKTVKKIKQPGLRQKPKREIATTLYSIFEMTGGDMAYMTWRPDEDHVVVGIGRKGNDLENLESTLTLTYIMQVS